MGSAPRRWPSRAPAAFGFRRRGALGFRRINPSYSRKIVGDFGGRSPHDRGICRGEHPARNGVGFASWPGMAKAGRLVPSQLSPLPPGRVTLARGERPVAPPGGSPCERNGRWLLRQFREAWTANGAEPGLTRGVLDDHSHTRVLIYCEPPARGHNANKGKRRGGTVVGYRPLPADDRRRINSGRRRTESTLGCLGCLGPGHDPGNLGCTLDPRAHHRMVGGHYAKRPIGTDHVVWCPATRRPIGHVRFTTRSVRARGPRARVWDRPAEVWLYNQGGR